MANTAAGHLVAVIGGATAGAEVASRLADRGVSVCVFEQNVRPYGKIEDGLPRWHEALRQKEYKTIDEKLSKLRRVQYSLFLQVVEVETGLILFQNEVTRSKAVQR